MFDIVQHQHPLKQMSLALIHPPGNSLPSGGNIYNQQILQLAQQHAFPLRAVVMQDIEKNHVYNLCSSYQGLIWDSLYWRNLAIYSELNRHTQSCLLCHYLPSLNPTHNQTQTQYWRKIENHVLDAMRFIIVTGAGIENEIKTRFPNKSIQLCEPGVDSVFQYDASRILVNPRTTHLLTVANLSPEKGYLQILQSLAAVKRTDWIWHICGSDTVNHEFTQQFRRLAETLGISKQIIYHGCLLQANIAELMHCCDIFVAFSAYEAYGMATAEAAVMRLPIICTRTGAASQIVDHGINGYLLACDDTPALADYLQRLIASNVLRAEFRKRQTFMARSWMACFTCFQAACEQFSKDISGKA